MEDNEILFEAKSPLGYSVVLSSDRYYNHIISSDGGHTAHAEFEPEEIKQGIEKPVAIYEGRESDTDVYFAKTSKQYPSRYLKVAVAVYPDIGDVKTAFLSKEIKGGIKDGGLKYFEYSNEL